MEQSAATREPTSVAEAPSLMRRVVDRNPELLEAAFRLHRERGLPPNTWVFDLDAVAANADLLAATAHEHGLTTYVMTKQYNRNPFVTKVALKRGLNKSVAVDIHGARVMHRYAIPVGHIGHLNQVPFREIEAALRIEPDVITVFSVENAAQLSRTAQRLGLTQDILIRPVGADDVFFEGQEGGFPEAQLNDALDRLEQLPNLRIVGVTSFPCVRYNFAEDSRSEPQANPNLATLGRIADLLRSRGHNVTQLNAPGNTSVETMPLLASGGATHVEPGHGLIGTTPNHIYSGELPEKPAYVYVSEVSHHVGDRAYAFGGGLWSLIAQFLDKPGQPAGPMEALVGRDADSFGSTVLEYQGQDQIIDYHASLGPGTKAQVGDTVVMAFYTQAQMTRSYIAPVSGISTGEPELQGLFDMGTHMLDDDYAAVAPAEVVRQIDALLERY